MTAAQEAIEQHIKTATGQHVIRSSEPLAARAQSPVPRIPQLSQGVWGVGTPILENDPVTAAPEEAPGKSPRTGAPEEAPAKSPRTTPLPRRLSRRLSSKWQKVLTPLGVVLKGGG